jgi:antitoxin (DNA-binding transcriptional repressor) of toxin-antitoxin stability system
MKKNSLTQEKLNSELLSLSISQAYAQDMTRSVDINDSANSLPKLADEVLSGQEVIFSRDGKPVMKLVSLDSEEMQAARLKGHYRKLGEGAKFLEDFDWDQWEQSDRDMERVWKKFGYMQ